MTNFDTFHSTINGFNAPVNVSNEDCSAQSRDPFLAEVVTTTTATTQSTTTFPSILTTTAAEVKNSFINTTRPSSGYLENNQSKTIFRTSRSPTTLTSILTNNPTEEAGDNSFNL